MRSRLLILIPLAALLASCGTPGPTTLYYWGGAKGSCTAYEQYSYETFKYQSPEAVCKLLCTYEEMVSKPGGFRKTPPPGICAEYGYLLLKPETATYFLEHATPAQKKMFGSGDYVTMFAEHGKEMFRKELELYPESRIFLEPLMRKLLK